ncbi:MAG: DoxX family protein, partial [Pseudomonadota bacterium]|nr:DoxX family protein [Pseudomonadota bacterium]
MRPNPLTDVIAFLTKPGWTSWTFWLLLAGSLVIACVALARDPEQRSTRNVALWLARVLVGAMWWQQSLWKLPPDFGGLLYWMKQMV